MKLLVKIDNQEIGKFKKFTNSFLIGLKNYSVSYLEMDIEEIKKILNDNSDIELFVSINKNIFNEDLDDLKEKLIELAYLNIKGILFYDLSIVSIVKSLGLNINLVYHQTHMVTNYNICNFYYNLGVKYGYLSTEITEKEMREIANNTKMKLMAYFIGHPIISHSKRKLVSNFYQFIGKTNDKKVNIIKEKGKDSKYYIEENKIGTNILTENILNGSRAFVSLKDKLEYAILDNYLIDNNIFLKILGLFKDNLDNKLDNELFIKKVNKFIGINDGFFYQKTIYKVKK